MRPRSSGSNHASPRIAPSWRRRSRARTSSWPRDRPAWRCCVEDFWSEHPSIELLADYNAADPLGIEGTKATDDLVDYDGKLVLGALAIGGPKMKVHKTCIRRMFESNDKVFDTDTVYEVAKELV